jgi:hypothetical protein
VISSRLGRVAAGGAAAALLALGTAGVARASTGWTEQNVPVPAGSEGGALLSVSCVNGGTCVAVGDETTVNAQGRAETLLYAARKASGTSWKATAVPQPTNEPYYDDLDGVSCTSTAFCMAVGEADNSEAVAETWNGTSWTAQTVPNPAGGGAIGLYGVSCVSSTACMAVGSYVNSTGEIQYGLAESWNGTSWTAMPTASEPNDQAAALNGVSCSAASSCMAFGNYFASTGGSTILLAESWNGSTWTNTPFKQPTGKYAYNLYGVSCPTTTVCTITGYGVGKDAAVKGVAERWDGSTWSVLSVPQDVGFGAVSCPTTGYCIAAGGPSASSATPGAESWTSAGGWTPDALAPVTDATSAGLNDVSCLSTTNCTGAGHYVRTPHVKGASGAFTEHE